MLIYFVPATKIFLLATWLLYIISFAIKEITSYNMKLDIIDSRIRTEFMQTAIQTGNAEQSCGVTSIFSAGSEENSRELADLVNSRINKDLDIDNQKINIFKNNGKN